MAGPLDAQVMIAAESVYGTGVTPTRSYEWDLSGSEHSFDPKVIIGTGMQVGDGGFARADRSVSVIGQGSGKMALDYQTKGMGVLVNGPYNNSTVTLVSGTTYQHNFTSALTASLLQSFTAQYGIIRSDAAGTVDAYTYLGTTFTKHSIKCAAGEIVSTEFEWDAKAQTVATALATPAYPAGLLDPYHFGEIVCTVGGSLTVPTTTALAVTGTVVNDVKSFEYALDNQADTERWVFGSRNQPRVGARAATLKLSTEYNATTYDAAQIAHTTLPVTITATSTQALSTGFATVQLVFPACKIKSSNRPSPQAGTPTVDYEFDIRKPASGAAIYIVHRTSDAAL
jgi:hypothetical protein